MFESDSDGEVDSSMIDYFLGFISIAIFKLNLCFCPPQRASFAYTDDLDAEETRHNVSFASDVDDDD